VESIVGGVVESKKNIGGGALIAWKSFAVPSPSLEGHAWPVTF